MVGSIGVATFSRPEDLDRCLNSIINARGDRKIPLLVLHQLGNKEVSKVIVKWKSQIQILLEVQALGNSPLQNMNLNSIILRELAFNSFCSDWYLGVEEDVVLGGDSIDFVEKMMQKYISSRDFRGVNLGSCIPSSSGLENFYSKIRYGIQGQASAITSRTWNHFDKKYLIDNSATHGLDAMMERYVKSGFMCWPQLSRYLDNGWNGTHSSKDPNNEYYERIRKSFVDLPNKVNAIYKLKNNRIPWREDCYLYRRQTNLIHIAKNLIFHYCHTVIRKIKVSRSTSQKKARHRY